MMGVLYGLLTADPLIGPDGRVHRWTDDDRRQLWRMFDEPTIDAADHS